MFVVCMGNKAGRLMVHCKEFCIHSPDLSSFKCSNEPALPTRGFHTQKFKSFVERHALSEKDLSVCPNACFFGFQLQVCPLPIGQNLLNSGDNGGTRLEEEDWDWAAVAEEGVSGNLFA